MIELYLSKVTDSSESEQAGKLYARVSYKQTLDVQAMARHMAEHNTMFSEGSITGILIDFVKCVREQVLNGNRWPLQPSVRWPKVPRPAPPSRP